MTLSAIQTSFGTGEWAPKLRARVDQKQYRSGAALMRNFFVDYSGGGASTRQGTKYINQCKALGARLIPFQPSVNLSYELEFGQNYIRFFSNGAPILETAVTILGAVNGSNPLQLNNSGSWAVGDWLFFQNIQGLVAPGGTTSPLNGNYFIVGSIVGPNITLTDLKGNAVNASTWSNYVVSSGTASRVYTLSSPYNASDLFPNQSTGNPGLKWAQDVTSMIITHPSYSPYILTINSATNWTLTSITFGPTLSAPVPSAVATAITGSGWFYGYIVTAVDNNGQESAPSNITTNSGGGAGNIQTTADSNLNFGWPAVPGAVSYNVYKVAQQHSVIPNSGLQFGFVGNIKTTSWFESFPGVAPDFSQTPPIVSSPIVGGVVTGISLQTNSSFSSVPFVTIAPAPAGGFTATAFASLGAFSISPTSTMTVFNQTPGQNPTGSVLQLTNGCALIVQAASAISSNTFNVTQVGVAAQGSITGAGTAAPTVYQVPSTQTAMTNGWFFTTSATCSFNISWRINALGLTQGGFGYTSAPGVTFFPAGASAITTVSPISTTGSGVLGAAPVGNPRCVTFFQQRMMLASPNAGLQSFYFSQPGSFFNFNTSNPVQDDNGIFGSIISEELNDIRWLVPVPTGVMAGTGKGAWLINGGGGISTASPITPTNVSATPQAFNGTNDMRPLKANLDLLFVTNKGSYVRDQTYNIYANIFTGQDITLISNHLFFGHTLVDWCWAEEPFKTVWAIRNDGALLSLAYVKEQEVLGWAHHDTNGQFLSCCSVIETVGGNTVDAVYFIVQRLIGGVYYQYVERMADRYFFHGYEDAWSVDCALRTSPAVSPTSTLTITGNASAVGNSVTLSDTVGVPFLIGQVGWTVRAGGGNYLITAFISTSQVTATVARVPAYINSYNGVANQVTGYGIWQPVSSVSGLTQLIGQNVVGTVDGSVVGITSPLTVSASGTVNLPVTGTKITLGLQFTPQLQTLPLDLGEPTVQGKRKKIVAATVRVADTLGLQIGKTFNTLTTMKDFQIGAIPSTSSGVVQVTDLVNPSTNTSAPFIDGRTILDQDWESAGNYCLQQNLPYPATILGVMPEIILGDTGK